MERLTGLQAFQFNDLQRVGEQPFFGQLIVEPPANIRATAMASGPIRPCSEGCPIDKSTTAPATRQTMPMAMRRSKFSRNTNQTSSAVATPSKVSNNEAVLAPLRASP